MANYVPGTPSTLSGLGVTSVRKMAFDSKLRKDSVRPSVWVALKSAIKVIEGSISIIKAGIFMEVDGAPDSGAQSKRFSMGTPLKKAPRLGNANAILGNEDEMGLLYTEVFYNEIAKGVKYKRWGYDFNDTKYLDWVGVQYDALAEFMAEYRDTRIHQALTLQYSEELTNAPVSKTPQFNKNWVIPNLAESSYPAWDLTAMTTTDGAADASTEYYNSRYYSGATSFVENIATALLSASGTSGTPKATMTTDFLAQLSYYLGSGLVIDPIELDGVPTYIILVADRVAAWMMNSNNTGSTGAYWATVKDYKEEGRMTIPGELGRAYGNLVFVKNMRAPTLVVGGSEGSYTLTVGFLNPGNVDDRNASAWSATSGSVNYVFDLCYALGKNALAEYVVDEMRGDLYEQTEYGKIEGRACYTGSGIQIPIWDKDSASRSDTAGSVTAIQRGSAIIPVSRASIETIA